MYLVFRILLSIAHFVNNCYCVIQHTFKSLVLSIEQSLFLNKINYNCESMNSKNLVIKTPKIPCHLAIILGQEEISALDLAKLVSWCILAKIPHVSFYDHKGHLLENQDFLKKKISEVEPFVTKNIEWSNLPNSAIFNLKNVQSISEFNSDVEITNINADATCKIHKDKTKVQVLSYNDGKERIVGVTKSLAKIINLDIIQEKDITSELIDRILRKDVEVPDPDLAIVFGKLLCTYGFLPWQTRITEFFVLPTHHNMLSSNFADILAKFSRCQQHYGK